MGESIYGVTFFILMNAFFVLAEFAIVSADRIKLKARYSGLTLKLALKQQDKVDLYLASCQLGITIASLALGWIGEPYLAKLIGHRLEPWLGRTIITAISFSLITALHITFGEQLPKVIGIASPEQWAILISIPLEIFTRIFYPFILSLQAIVKHFANLLRVDVTSEHSKRYNVEELRLLITEFRQQGRLPHQKGLMLEHVLKFEDVKVEEVMIPRLDVIGIEESTSVPKLMKLIAKYKHSRYPVYRGNLDNVIGIVHVKDITLSLLRGNLKLSDIIRPVPFLPESSSLLKALEEMRKSRVHMAIVLDEYGGTKGIITLEDIVEYLMGEIADEFDELSADPVVKLEENRYALRGDLTLTELKEFTGIDLSDVNPEVITVGGLVFSLLGRVPKVGEEVKVRDYKLKVLKLKGRRIIRVELSKLESGNSDDRGEVM